MEQRGLQVSCDNCVGSCCTDSRLPLTAKEAEFLRGSGTDLRVLFPPLSVAEDRHPVAWKNRRNLLKEAVDEFTEDKYGRIVMRAVLRKLAPGEGLYEIHGSCGNLQEDGKCGIYETDESADIRPNICRDFEAGSFACLEFRNRDMSLIMQRAEVRVELIQKPQAS